jgi:maltooligosyltrehalose synthase
MPRAGDVPLGRAVWQDTVLVLPEQIRNRTFRDVFTGEGLDGRAGMALAEMFGSFPVALLLAQD